jgi:transposase
VDIIAPDYGTGMVSSALEAAWPMSNATGGKRCRRVWSAEEKQRIVDEAVVPGASVAEIARRHGVNANLVFTWRRAAQANAPTATELSASPKRAQSHPAAPASGPCEFIPIGVFGRPDDGSPAVTAGPSAAVVGATSLYAAASPRPRMDDRPGAIEIDLADGARLRVDAFVNERALRRVLAALKAKS